MMSRNRPARIRRWYFSCPRRDKGWEDYAEVQVRIVPGSHYTMVKEPHVRELAQQLREA